MRDVHPPGVQILSISCSFGGNLANSYVDATNGELVPPNQGNPGSSTGFYYGIFHFRSYMGSDMDSLKGKLQAHLWAKLQANLWARLMS